MKDDNPFKPVKLCLQKVIIENTNLSHLDRLLLMIVVAFDNDKGCFATNLKLAKYLNCSVGTISKSINHMEALGYIISNETKSGRNAVRRVRDDLKNYKSDKSFSTSSHSELTTLTCDKPTLIDIKGIDKEFIELNKKEKAIFKAILKSSSTIAWRTYLLCKAKFKKHHHIEWDENNIKSLINLYNKITLLFSSITTKMGLKAEKSFIVNAFEIVTSQRPRYFYDSNPYAFFKYFNKIVQQEKVTERINRLKMRYGLAERDF